MIKLLNCQMLFCLTKQLWDDCVTSRIMKNDMIDKLQLDSVFPRNPTVIQ